MIRGSGGWELLGWIVSFTIITTIFVLLRFWSARIQKREFYLDDSCVIIAYVAMLAQQGIGIWSLVNGAGNASPDLSVDELMVQGQVLVAVPTTWVVSTTTVKLTVLALYMRIFSTASFKRWAISLMVFTVCFGITFFVVFLTRCHPVSQEWDPKPWGSCRPLLPSEASSISINLVLDAAIVVLPMPWLWGLNLVTGTKIITMIMFSFGFATIAIMGYRLDQTINSDPDPMVSMGRMGLLSNMELWLGIIVACIPTLAPFARTYIHPVLSRAFTKIYGSSSGGPSREETPRVQLRTFGSSGGPAALGGRSHGRYDELDEPSSDPARGYDEMRLVGNGASQLRTEVRRGDPGHTPAKDEIHVHKQFQTFENV